MTNKSFHIVLSYGIFTLTLVTICLNLVSVIFPAFIITYFSNNQNLDLFEIGYMAIPLVIINVFVIIFVILHYLKKSPQAIHNGIKKITNFEPSTKITFLTILVLLVIYVSLSLPELAINEAEQFQDYAILKDALDLWPDGNPSDVYVKEQMDRTVRMVLLSFSFNVINNVKIIPFVVSISLLILTYFFTKEISGNRLAGIISVIVVLQSYTFLAYDTIAVYENFWVLFYVLSLYLILKKTHLSFASYFLSIFSKAITISFLPMSLFFIYCAKISSRKKIITYSLYIMVIIITFLIFQSSESIYSDVITIHHEKFWKGMTTWAFNLRFDYLMMFFILPLSVGLFLKSRQNFPYANPLMVLITGAFLTGPILVTFTDFYFIYPYRFIPLVIFFAVGIGYLFSKKLDIAITRNLP